MPVGFVTRRNHMDAKIIDRGRGPEIAVTRITVYDVLDYLQEGWGAPQIAGLFRLSLDDIQAAIQYIEDHKDEGMVMYQKILGRHRNYQYPPDVQEKLARSREKFKAKLAEIRARQEAESSHASDHGRS
jgi:uncharacterized protein (DUF433 family)